MSPRLSEPAVSDLTAKDIVEDHNPDLFLIVYAVDDVESFSKNNFNKKENHMKRILFGSCTLYSVYTVLYTVHTVQYSVYTLYCKKQRQAAKCMHFKSDVSENLKIQ